MILWLYCFIGVLVSVVITLTRWYERRDVKRRMKYMRDFDVAMQRMISHLMDDTSHSNIEDVEDKDISKRKLTKPIIMTKLTNESYLKLHTNESLKALLVDVMNEYARRFCEMYDFQEGWWVADDPCGTYCTDDIEVSISASELVFCVVNDIDGDTFSQWWEYVLNTDEPTINLRSWCIGARPEMTKGGEK